MSPDLTPLILFSFRRCPYAIRARMALRQSGLPHDIREVSLRDKPQDFLSISSKGTVPVLLSHTGEVIDQSLDIMRWALERNDPDAWLAQAGEPCSQMLIADNDGPFKYWLDRYKYFDRFPQASQGHYRSQGVECLISKLETCLTQIPYLCGQRAGLADVAIFPFVRQFAAVDADWFDRGEWPHTQNWLRHWTESALFKSVMFKRPEHCADHLRELPKVLGPDK